MHDTFLLSYNFADEPAQSGQQFGNGQSTEKSIKSCYAVVYELDNRKWVVAGEGGWSEVHLCEDSLDNSHRILAWTVKSQQVCSCNNTYSSSSFIMRFCEQPSCYHGNTDTLHQNYHKLIFDAMINRF